MPAPGLIGGGEWRQHFAPAFWLPIGMDPGIIGSDRKGDSREARSWQQSGRLQGS